jgi:hypothetical protein
MLLAIAGASGDARADEAAPDPIPGSPRPPGVDLAPDAPPVPPAPGGRAPSFGAPADNGEWSFRIGGRISGWEAFGIGRTPQNPPPGYKGTPLHVPILSQGRLPFWPGAGATLSLQYGNPVLTAYVLYYARFNSPQYQGYYNPQNGPAFGQAYLLVNPEPIGPLRLLFRVGGFVETYGGPGQWGWGIFGPLLAVRGFGETSNADYDLTPDLRLSLTHGVLAVPGVPENWVRGDYNNWIETGVSAFVHHAHAGLIYKNQYTFRLHYASSYGTDERMYLKTFLNQAPHDGRMDTFLAEARWVQDPYGQVGVTAGLWNFDHAASVGDGIWWGLDWTQGAREMINKFIGPYSTGTGKVAAVSAEYDTSIARILWYPRSFDGNGPDLRIAVGGTVYWTLATDDTAFMNTGGFYLGTELEYRFLSWLSATFSAYGENRASPLYSFCTPPGGIGQPGNGASTPGGTCAVYVGPGARWAVYSVNPGIRFHSDWSSTDSIQLIYSRRFYSSAVDNNPAMPLDTDAVTLGAYVQF